MADSGITIQAQSTLFERRGTTLQQKAYSPNTALAGYIWTNLVNSVLSSNASTIEEALLRSLMSQNSEIIPGGLTLYNTQALDATLYPGAAYVQLLYELDPFGTEYETNTKALYERQYDVARARALSGPTNVRGGTARQAFELSDLDTQMAINRFREIWQNQLAVAELVLRAVHTATTSENARRSLQLQAQQQQAGTEQGRVMQSLAAAEHASRVRNDSARFESIAMEALGVPQMLTTESLAGQGMQSGLTTSFGMTSWR